MTPAIPWEKVSGLDAVLAHPRMASGILAGLVVVYWLRGPILGAITRERLRPLVRYGLTVLVGFGVGWTFGPVALDTVTSLPVVGGLI